MLASCSTLTVYLLSENSGSSSINKFFLTPQEDWHHIIPTSSSQAHLFSTDTENICAWKLVGLWADLFLTL